MKRLIIVLTTLFLSAILCEQYISAQPDATTSASVQQPGNANKPEVKAGGQSKGKVDEKAKKKAAKKAKKQLKKKQKKAE